MAEDPPVRPGRRNHLRGLDPKALLAAGLELPEPASPVPPILPSPPPAAGPRRTSRRAWLLGSLSAAGLAASAAWLGPRLRRTAVRDALAAVDLATALRRGEWARREQAVESLREDEPALLALPTGSLGGSYRVSLAFQRLAGTRAVALFFRTAAGVGSLEFDAWEQPGLAGVQLLDDHDLRQGSAFEFPLPNGVRHEFELRVSPAAVEVWTNGRQLQKHSLAGRRLSVASPWSWSGEWAGVSLAVGSWHSPTRFERVQVLPPG